jgi:hypothetical protein
MHDEGRASCQGNGLRESYHVYWARVARAEGGLRGEVRDYDRIANTAADLQRLIRKLRPSRGGVACGSAMKRGRAVTASQLSASEYDCAVIAPCLIPSGRGTGSKLTEGTRPVWEAASGRRVDRGVVPGPGDEQYATWCGRAMKRCEHCVALASGS